MFELVYYRSRDTLLPIAKAQICPNNIVRIYEHEFEYANKAYWFFFFSYLFP